MKKYFFSVLAVLCLRAAGECQVSVTKIFIVRHADRLGQGDDLSRPGLIRAAELKRVLGQSGIDSIFSTNFVRTRKTADPLAVQLGLPVVTYSAGLALINRIMTNSLWIRVLVVGHSDTVAKLIQSCGCTPPAAINPIPVNQFDNLFLVLIRRHTVNRLAVSKCEFIHMKYGAVTN